jgi:hypothetical protein
MMPEKSSISPDQLCRILGKSIATAKGKSRPRLAATPISAS